MTCKLAPRPGLIYEKSLDKLLDGAASRVGSQQKPYLDESLCFGKSIVHSLFLEASFGRIISHRKKECQDCFRSRS